MELIFLGTGGGRFNLVSQVRSTGGFRINGSLAIHADPGPGALTASIAARQDVSRLDVLVLSHNHIDHVNDAGLLAEAMANAGLPRGDGKAMMASAGLQRDYGVAHVKKGMAIGSKSVIEGDKHGDRGISFYHQSKLARIVVAETGVPIEMESGKGKAVLLPTPVRHEDKTGFGFVLEMDGKRIGYTSDTEYFEGISNHYKGCDILIANNLKPEKDEIPGHLDSHSTARLLAEAKPKLAIITHMGMKMLRAGPEKGAEKIEKASGVKTIAAKDGMRIDV